MKLTISRSQAKCALGLGAVNFEICGKVELTPEEALLVKRYKMEDTEVARRRLRVLGNDFGDTVVTARMLFNGDIFRAKNLSELLAYEEVIVESCVSLKSCFEVARNLEGNRVIEF